MVWNPKETHPTIRDHRRLMQPPVDNSIVKRCFATIYTPSRRRNRFPENCVTVVDSAQDAIESSQKSKDLHPAIVMGPSR